MSTKCTYIDESGKPCEAKPFKGSKYCFWHASGLEETRLQASKHGGLNRRLQALIEDFRTPQKMMEVFIYPELVHQKSQHYLNLFAMN